MTHIECALELEGWTLKECHAAILTGSHQSEGALGPEISWVDGLGLPHNRPNGSPSLSHENRSEPGSNQSRVTEEETKPGGLVQSISLFTAFTHSHNALAVTGPGNVLDCTTDGLVLILQDVLFLSGVPDANFPRGVCRRINMNRKPSCFLLHRSRIRSYCHFTSSGSMKIMDNASTGKALGSYIQIILSKRGLIRFKWLHNNTDNGDLTIMSFDFKNQILGHNGIKYEDKKVWWTKHAECGS